MKYYKLYKSYLEGYRNKEISRKQFIYGFTQAQELFPEKAPDTLKVYLVRKGNTLIGNNR